MQKKFECKNCSKQFEADDQGTVVCPHCHSDNVEPAGHRVPALVWKFISFVIIIMVVFGVILFSTSHCGGISGPEPPGPDTTFTNPPTVSVGLPVLNDDGTYSVDVKGKYVSSKMNVYYVMMSHFDKEVLQKSKDGHFKDIPFCEEDGHSYDFAIMDSNADTLLCFPVEQTGFIRQGVVKKEDRMTIEQLQSLIDSRDSSLNGVGESDYLSPDYKLTFTGIPSDQKKPESWTELFEMLDFGIYESVTVDKISYDDKNRVNSVTLKIVMSE